MLNQTNNNSTQSSDMSFYVIILAMIVAMAFYISSDIKQRYESLDESSIQQIQMSKSIVVSIENIATPSVIEARTQVLYSVPAISIPEFKPTPIYASYQIAPPPLQEKEPCREQEYEQYIGLYQAYPKGVSTAQYSNPYYNYQSFQNKEKYYQLHQQNYPYLQYQEQPYQEYQLQQQQYRLKYREQRYQSFFPY